MSWFGFHIDLLFFLNTCDLRYSSIVGGYNNNVSDSAEYAAIGGTQIRMEIRMPRPRLRPMPMRVTRFIVVVVSQVVAKTS